MPADGVVAGHPGMRLRSLLFVPGDRPERFEKAAASGADAIILDLEDSVVAASKPAAREAIAKFLDGASDGVARWVRVNPLDSDVIADDLAVAAQADGVMLPKSISGASVRDLARRIGERCPPILPVASETPAAVFGLGDYAGVTPLLAGITWGAEDLPAAIGAATAREADGSYTPPYEMVRALTLFGAHAAGVAAIETVYPDFRDLDGLAAYARRGARDGFTGMMAIHPAQVSVINTAFTPSETQIAAAYAVVEAFKANPGAGALQLDGRMIDAPHLKQALALLASAV
jgi:citrate lyase subunit beta/citryl-CoA lyase